MKRIWIIIALTLVVLVPLGLRLFPFVHATERPDSTPADLRPYINTITALLDDQISEAVASHYGAGLRWDGSAKILKIASVDQGPTYPIELIIQVHPFVGPHVSVGIDNITLWVNYGEVRLIRFDHIQDSDLPERLQEDWYKAYRQRIGR